MRKLIIQVLFVVVYFVPIFTYSQNKFDKYDFTKVDSIARTVKYGNDLYQLTRDLTGSYSSDIVKVRAIFIWITDNIQYDYKSVNKGREIKGPDCEGIRDCTQRINEWERNYLKTILKKEKAVCDGYARVFKKMCDIAGIQSEIVPGYTKTKPYQIGTSFSVNHAWNAVLIDSTYYFLDATWAAGKCIEDEDTEMLTDFIKDFDNYYWLTPFDKLKRNHYPENGRWVPEPNFTKEKFSSAPFYANDILDKMNLISPTTGIIQAKKGDTIHFKFSYDGKVSVMQLNSNVYKNPDLLQVKDASRRRKILELDTVAVRLQKYVDVRRTGNMFEFDYIVTDNSLYYLDLLFDYRRVMRFKVKSDI